MKRLILVLIFVVSLFGCNTGERIQTDSGDGYKGIIEDNKYAPAGCTPVTGQIGCGDFKASTTQVEVEILVYGWVDSTVYLGDGNIEIPCEPNDSKKSERDFKWFICKGNFIPGPLTTLITIKHINNEGEEELITGKLRVRVEG